MKKGLDATFVHYGIRKDDMRLIEALCATHQLDADWLKDDILKRYHDERIQQADGLTDKAVEKLIDKAVLKIR